MIAERDSWTKKIVEGRSQSQLIIILNVKNLSVYNTV